MESLAGKLLSLKRDMEDLQRLSPCGGVHVKLMGVEKFFSLLFYRDAQIV